MCISPNKEITHMITITKSNRTLLLAAAALVVVAGLTFVIWKFTLGAPPGVPEADYWPTQSWLTSTPEEQGLDSAKLAEGLLKIQQKNIPIHSLIIVRNGRMVLNATFYPYNGQSPHSVGSVTKSLTTLLIGIAIDQGKLSLDDKLVSFFPDSSLANPDDRKNNIRIRDLASMSSGFECIYEPNEPTVQAMETSPNWVQFGLDLPMAHKPGTHWEYCGVGMHLLSAILEKATGMTALEFARQNLFKPLGIQEVFWPADPQGVHMGAGNTRLLPKDMAKIGYLYLHGGVWDGKQIVSRSWVEESVKKHFDVPNGDRYGYGWWSSGNGSGRSFFAQGNGGQRIVVNPGYNSIVVTTGEGLNYDELNPYILAAFLDPKNPLPANPAGVAELQRVLATLPLPPDPHPVPALPGIATAISGKTFLMAPNPFGIESVRLVFDAAPQARLQITFIDGTPSPLAAVGLDGIYRLTPGMNLDRSGHPFVDFQNLSVGLRGGWTGAQTFVLEYDTIVNYYYYQLQMNFNGDKLYLAWCERTGVPLATITGTMENP
jgi:CubicO group peptidase (beta-lactamase class C family)